MMVLIVNISAWQKLFRIIYSPVLIATYVPGITVGVFVGDWWSFDAGLSAVITGSLPASRCHHSHITFAGAEILSAWDQFNPRPAGGSEISWLSKQIFEGSFGSDLCNVHICMYILHNIHIMYVCVHICVFVYKYVHMNSLDGVDSFASRSFFLWPLFRL